MAEYLQLVSVRCVCVCVCVCVWENGMIDTYKLLHNLTSRPAFT